MRPHGLLIALCALVVLAGGVYWSNREKKIEESKPSKDASPKIVSIPENDVTQLEFKRKDGASTIIKRGANNKWEMVAPSPLPVDQDAASGVVNSLNPLNSDQLIDEKASNLAVFGLAQPAFELTVTKKDGKTQQVQIGDEAPAGGDVYVKLAGDPKVYTMSSSLKSSLDKTAQDLRDKRLLTFDQDKLTRVELAAKKQDLEFGKNNANEWQIVKPKPFRADNWQVEELIRKLHDAKMDASTSNEDAKKAAEAFTGGTQIATAKVTDASGTQTLDVRKNKDDYYAKSSVVQGIFKISADLGQGLDKGIDDFRNKKLFDFGFSDPTKIEVQDDVNGKQAAYAKSGDKWYSGPKQIDNTSLQNFVDKVRDLSATKFVDFGFTTPIFEVTVTSNNGKRVEKVSISKNGDDYFAKRENEPSIYQLDAKAAQDLINAAKDIKEAQQASGKK
jgi:hypothetical protein